MAGKRKSDVDAPSGKAKKVKPADHATAKALLVAVVADPENCELEFDISDEVAVRKALADVANYTRSLEEEVEGLKTAQATGGAEKPAKSPDAIEVEADRIADTIVRGIERQMAWKPSCKTNSAKFVFDGYCPDPLVFGALLELGGPPKFKQKKFKRAKFEDLVGIIQGSARYNVLRISSSDVNVRYNAESGEFKISGSYGITPG